MTGSREGWRCALLVMVLCTSIAPAAAAAETASPRIHDIQAETRLSPFAERRVDGVPGVVTAVRAFGSSRGFWFQDPHPDDDPRTSEGLFVFTGKQTPEVRPGDAVTVRGTVAEYYPDDGFQSVTELVDARWTVESSRNPLPEAEILTPHTVPEQYAPQPGGSIERLPLDPGRYALDFYESREGMRLRLDGARVVGPTTEYDEFYLTSKPGQHPSPRGGTVYSGYDEPNSGRLKVESLIPFDQRPLPRVDVGDRLTGSTAGPLDYDQYGGYTLQASTLGEHRPGRLPRETVRPQRSGELAVATYNVENLSTRDDQATFDRLATGITANLANPDIVALEEIQDDSGPADDGVTTAERTLRRLTQAIAAAGGPRYEWRQIDPVNNADGGQPGGNIRVAFLFNPARVSFVDRPGGDASTPVRVHDGPALSASPGRVDPANPAWTDTRKPLAGEFVFGGRRVFVVANHFSSKGDDQPLHGPAQPPQRMSEAQRVRQAASVRSFVDKLLRADERANVVVAGDLNDYAFSPALDELTSGGLRNLADGLPESQRYSYLFEGNSQLLDHVLTSSAPRGVSYRIAHINAEFADQASDHDPQLARLRPAAANPLLDAWYDWLDLLERITGRPTLPPD